MAGVKLSEESHARLIEALIHSTNSLIDNAICSANRVSVISPLDELDKHIAGIQMSVGRIRERINRLLA